MPRGIYNREKPKEEVKEKPQPEVIKHELSETKKEEKREEVLKPQPVPVVEKPKLEPLGPGQKYFETPEGEILIGEEGKGHTWSRKMNGGKGGWANEKR